jgi:hypothetical protein
MDMNGTKREPIEEIEEVADPLDVAHQWKHHNWQDDDDRIEEPMPEHGPFPQNRLHPDSP